MKRIFTAAVVTLLVTCFSTSAFAHSHFEGSNPADGDIVTEPLSEIILEFGGQIEEGSFIDVKTIDGEAVEIQDIIIGEGTLTGTVAEPLINDEYQVNWSIVSADGHPLEGELAFTVNVEVPETIEEETEEPSETEVIENEASTATESAKSTDTTEQLDEEEESSSVNVFIIVALVVIVIIGIFLLMKRKK